jgi:hypothetical protein
MAQAQTERQMADNGISGDIEDVSIHALVRSGSCPRLKQRAATEIGCN